MKTLYVSDLDGTLLNSKKQITPYTVRVLNACIEKGMLFTVATARMAYACDYRLEGIKLSTPGILTNGVFLYDFDSREYVSVEEMDRSLVPDVIGAFRRNGCSCFLYTLKNGRISIYYGDARLREQTQYYSEKALKNCEEVALVSDYMEKIKNAQVFYVALTGTGEQLAPVRRDLEKIPGVSCAYYLNIYNGMYCIEVFSGAASKKNALKKLQKLAGCDELVVFGDNLNDLSMIEIADRSYAPANALPEVKERVTAVLEDCDSDGVAKFLAREWGIGGA